MKILSTCIKCLKFVKMHDYVKEGLCNKVL